MFAEEDSWNSDVTSGDITQGPVLAPFQSSFVNERNEFRFVLNSSSPFSDDETNGDVLDRWHVKGKEGIHSLTFEWQIAREISWSRLESVTGFRWGNNGDGRRVAWRVWVWEEEVRLSGRTAVRHLSIVWTESTKRIHWGAIIAGQPNLNILKTNTNYLIIKSLLISLSLTPRAKEKLSDPMGITRDQKTHLEQDLNGLDPIFLGVNEDCAVGGQISIWLWIEWK
jgi:hypothetical protein